MNNKLPSYQKHINIIVASILFVLVAILIGPITISLVNSLIKMLTIKNTNIVLMLGFIPIIIIYYQITKIINELNKSLQLKYYLGSLIGLYLIPIISGLIGTIYFKTIKNAMYNEVSKHYSHSIDTHQTLALCIGLTTTTLIWIILQIVYSLNLKDNESFKFKFKTNSIFTAIVIIIAISIIAIISPNFMLFLLLTLILTGMISFTIAMTWDW